MQNNLTKKDIEKLNKWAKEYDIKELQTKNRNKLLNIKELTLGTNFRDIKPFSYIPNEVFKIINIESLSIYSGKLKGINKNISNLINLKEFDIHCCSLKKLPKEIGNLTNLKKLEIGCKKSNELPKELFNLTNLKEFEIKKRKFRKTA